VDEDAVVGFVKKLQAVEKFGVRDGQRIEERIRDCR
jgi:hypothetical protein